MTLQWKSCRFWKDHFEEENITIFLIQCVETRTVQDVELPTGEDVPKNQSKVIKPSREELLEKHQTRLKHKNNWCDNFQAVILSETVS